jgi:membrane associated rhomboid family serine protease
MLSQIFKNIPSVTKNLIIINVLVFIAMLLFRNTGFDLNKLFGLYFYESAQFKPFQIATTMFSHANFGHIFFNMFALFMFGSQLERVWGAKRYLFFYFAAGIGASMLHEAASGYEVHKLLSDFSASEADSIKYMINTEGYESLQLGKNFIDPILGKLNMIFNIPAVGASGAIYGLLVAFGMLFPNTELMLIFFPVPVKAKYFIPVLILIEFFMGTQDFQWDNTAHFAHLGGALIGFILVKYWQKTDKNNFY